MPKELIDLIKKRLTLSNPAWIKALRRYNNNPAHWGMKKIPKVFTYYEQLHNGSMLFPKGFVGVLIKEFIMPAGLKYELKDERVMPLCEKDYKYWS
ncbi:MAG: hypothetical protein U9Q38_09375 [Thermodesulfobacteriota bacterium]|nr:hypothetical protein [Thermodesulfobacteriota bacterium]